MQIRSLNLGLAAAVCFASLASAADFDTSTNVLAQARTAAANMKGVPASAPMDDASGSAKENLQPQEIVIDDKNVIGIVITVFNGGRVSVRNSPWTLTDPVYNESQLTPEVPSRDGFKGQDIVINKRTNKVGIIIKLFKDGRASVRYSPWHARDPIEWTRNLSKKAGSDAPIPYDAGPV